VLFGDSSVSRKKSVVVLVAPDPVPDDPFTLQDADRSVIARYANGIDGRAWLTRLNWEPGCLGLSVKVQ